MSKTDVLVNILTRTSGRPIGFNNCRHSVRNQKYKRIRHIVSCEDGLNFSEDTNIDGVDFITVKK